MDEVVVVYFLIQLITPVELDVLPPKNTKAHMKIIINFSIFKRKKISMS